MKLYRLFIFISFLINSMNLHGQVQTNPNFLDEELSDNRYIIIYIKLHNIPDENAKAYALVHAAELAHAKGYSYLTLDSIENVIITKSEAIASGMPGNLFQQLIVEGDFGQKAMARVNPKTTNVYKAVKIYVTFYIDEPKKGNVYEVCSLIFCK